MEIGPQYLMRFNKNIIKEKELSIQIYMDGFSFCTHSSQLFFDYESTPLDNYYAFKKKLRGMGTKRKSIHVNLDG